MTCRDNSSETTKVRGYSTWLCMQSDSSSNICTESTKDISLVLAIGFQPELGSESARDACAGDLGRLDVSKLHQGMMSLAGVVNEFEIPRATRYFFRLKSGISRF